MKFTGTVFSSKRANGWVSVLGDADVDELAEVINSRCIEFEEGRLVVKQAEGEGVRPKQVGEVLLAAVQHYFPKIDRTVALYGYDDMSNIHHSKLKL